jgi:hypothetical protein
MVIRLKTEEDEFEFEYSVIKPTSFYSSEHEKTKLNWFCFEISVGLFDEIKKDHGRRLKKKKIDDKAIAEFSIYVSKKMKDIVLQKLAGKIDTVYISYEMVELYFPTFNERLVNKILDTISKVWDEQLSFCGICPTRCISEKDAYCVMFDDEDYCL